MTQPCGWCEAPLTPRTSGGIRQKFCSTPCRRAFDRAIRAWARDALATGRLSVDDLRGTASNARVRKTRPVAVEHER